MPERTQILLKTEVMHLEDLELTVVMKVFGWHVEFVVYELVNWFVEYDEKPTWQLRGALTSPTPTQDLEQAETFISGSVKWDGCSNWDLMPDAPRPGYFHGCSREDLTKIGEVMARCYDLTVQYCPSWIDGAGSSAPALPA